MNVLRKVVLCLVSEKTQANQMFTAKDVCDLIEATGVKIDCLGIEETLVDAIEDGEIPGYFYSDVEIDGESVYIFHKSGAIVNDYVAMLGGSVEEEVEEEAEETETPEEPVAPQTTPGRPLTGVHNSSWF